MEYIKTFYMSILAKDILDELLIFFLVLFGCYILNKLLKRYFIKIIKNTIRSESRPIWFRYRLIKKPIKVLLYIIQGIIVYIGLYYAHIHLLNQTVNFVKIFIKITITYLMFAGLIFTNSFIDFAEKIYTKHINTKKTNISIKSILDVVKTILWALVSIGAFGVITDTPIANIFTGIGAIGAVGAFMFQDTIKNFIACMHLIAHDLVHIGDWIEIPNTKANGIVRHISFNMIQIENYDRTIITLPTQILISSGIINSNNMIQGGNRQIKKDFTIYTNTIKFISKEEFEEILKNKKISDILGSVEYRPELTNLELFRIYIVLYLKSSKNICQKSLILVRLVEIKEDKASLQIIASTHIENITLYEDMNAKIVENFISILNILNMGK